MYDIVIKDGQVFDGAGAGPVQTDIGIVGETIARIGTIEAVGNAAVLDAEALFVAPGFVDIHSHSDYTLLVDGRAISSISQGVTTELVGNCGFGCFPIRDQAKALQAIYGYDGRVETMFASAAEYLDGVAASAPAVNVATLVPHGQLMISTAEYVDGLPERLRLLEAALEQGAGGLSLGLEYPVETDVPTTELAALCRVVGRRDALLAVHTRQRESRAVEAVGEAIELAKGCGARLQISHLAPRSGLEMTRRCIAAADQAWESGLDVQFDMHTRRAGTTYLFNVLPAAVLNQSVSSRSTMLRDPLQQARIRREAPPIFAERDWSELLVVYNEQLPELSNRTVREISESWSMDPDTAVYEILARYPEQSSSLMVLLPCYTEEQQAELFSHPLCIPASDATALCPDGPLGKRVFHGAYTWSSWYWRFMVTQKKLLTPEAAIHRLTGRPAQIARIADRGLLREGMKADVCAFDPGGFADQGTIKDPNRIARGMRFVLVNGCVSFEAGTGVSVRAGRAMTRFAA